MKNSPPKIAIMQPYLFPYIGYFQLISAVDEFVFYDDVQWIKGGWINRHTILLNGQEKIVALPVAKHSTFSLINEVFWVTDSSAKVDYLEKLKNAYKKAPHFSSIFPVIEKIINIEEANVSKFILNSFEELKTILDIETKFSLSSNIDYNSTLPPQQKLIDITKKLNGKSYINTIKGQHLYSKENFAEQGINLMFLDRVIKPYKQFGNDFVPYLSIIDVLMFNSIEEVQQMIKEYTLI